MRTRRTILLGLVVVLALLPLAMAPVVAVAAQKVLEGDTVVLAQELEEDSDSGGDPADEGDAGQGAEADEEGEGQSGTDAETGADEGEQAPAAEETGPVWTYQMARIGLGLLVLLLAAVGFTYWKLVAHRQRAGV